MPTVTIRRTRETVNMISDYVVYVDGRKQGVVKRGKKLKIELEPGSYTLTAAMDDYGSEAFPLAVGEHDINLSLSSFRFNSLLLPLLVSLILLFSYLHQLHDVSWWAGALCISPLLGVAVYYHFLRRDRYLVYRWRK